MPELIRYRGVVYQRVAASSLLARVNALRSQLAGAAQKVVDVWEQDDEGFDCELGGGGPCDEVARELQGVLSDAGINSIEGGHEGDDHAWLIAYDERTKELVGVDIPPGVYETGGGYKWTKLEDTTVTPSDVAVWPINEKFDDVIDPDMLY